MLLIVHRCRRYNNSDSVKLFVRIASQINVHKDQMPTQGSGCRAVDLQEDSEVMFDR